MSRKKVLILSTIGLALAATLVIFLASRRTVTLVVDGNPQTLTVRAWTVGGALQAAGIAVDERDILQPQKSAWLENGQSIELIRARDVNIQVLPDGEAAQIVSGGRTVAGLLAEAGVSLGPQDRVWANGAQVSPQQDLPTGGPLALVVRRAQTIELTVDAETQTIISNAATLGEALAEAGILLEAADRLTPAAETPLNGSLKAALRRAIPLAIAVDGRVAQARSAAGTVGEALAEVGISLQGLDYSLPAEDQSLPGDGNLRVVRVNETLVLQQTTLPYTTKYENSDQVALDHQEVIVPGVLGIQVSRERVRFEDGQEVARNSDGSWVAQEPQEQTVGLGTKIEVKTIQTEVGELEYYRAISVYATAYSPCRSGVEGRCFSGTASGLPVQKGVIAVPRSWYGLLVGARVYIPGYGVAVVGDTGGMTGYWIDLAYTDADFVGWSQYVTLYFLTPVPAYVPVSLP